MTLIDLLVVMGIIAIVEGCAKLFASTAGTVSIGTMQANAVATLFGGVSLLVTVTVVPRFISLLSWL